MRLHVGGPFSPLRAFPSGFCLLSACLAVGSCVDVAGDSAPSADLRPQFVRRDGASMAGATVAIVSMEGAPAELSTRFGQDLDQAAAARQIAVTPAATARYLARGYLSASPAREGATVDIVWDVFTPDKKRVQRLSDAITIHGSGDDPWTMLGETELDSVAAKCADDLAAYLSNTPEAAPGAALSYAQGQ